MNTDITKKNKIKWLWKNMEGYHGLYMVGILGTILYNVLQLTVPHITQVILDMFLSGDDAAFSGLIWAIANPMRNLGNIMNEFQRFDAAAAKVMELYFTTPEIVDSKDAKDIDGRLKGKIEFKDVSFKYDDANIPVLHDISFTAEPGETVAIMDYRVDRSREYLLQEHLQ